MIIHKYEIVLLLLWMCTLNGNCDIPRPEISKDGKTCIFGQSEIKLNASAPCTKEIERMMKFSVDLTNALCICSLLPDHGIIVSASRSGKTISQGVRYKLEEAKISKDLKTCLFGSTRVPVGEPTPCNDEIARIMRLKSNLTNKLCTCTVKGKGKIHLTAMERSVVNATVHDVESESMPLKPKTTEKPANPPRGYNKNPVKGTPTIAVSVTSAIPETTPILETTPIQETTPILETTLIPETTAMPETTPIPVTTPLPETTPIPETTATLETTSIQENTLTPKTTPLSETNTPESTSPFETSSIPETTPISESTKLPEITETPETASEQDTDTTSTPNETSTDGFSPANFNRTDIPEYSTTVPSDVDETGTPNDYEEETTAAIRQVNGTESSNNGEQETTTPSSEEGTQDETTPGYLSDSTEPEEEDENETTTTTEPSTEDTDLNGSPNENSDNTPNEENKDRSPDERNLNSTITESENNDGSPNGGNLNSTITETESSGDGSPFSVSSSSNASSFPGSSSSSSSSYTSSSSSSSSDLPGSSGGGSSGGGSSGGGSSGGGSSGGGSSGGGEGGSSGGGSFSNSSSSEGEDTFCAIGEMQIPLNSSVPCSSNLEEFKKLFKTEKDISHLKCTCSRKKNGGISIKTEIDESQATEQQKEQGALSEDGLSCEFKNLSMKVNESMPCPPQLARYFNETEDISEQHCTCYETANGGIRISAQKIVITEKEGDAVSSTINENNEASGNSSGTSKVTANTSTSTRYKEVIKDESNATGKLSEDGTKCEFENLSVNLNESGPCVPEFARFLNESEDIHDQECTCFANGKGGITVTAKRIVVNEKPSDNGGGTEEEVKVIEVVKDQDNSTGKMEKTKTNITTTTITKKEVIKDKNVYSGKLSEDGSTCQFENLEMTLNETIPCTKELSRLLNKGQDMSNMHCICMLKEDGKGIKVKAFSLEGKGGSSQKKRSRRVKRSPGSRMSGSRFKDFQAGNSLMEK